MKFTHRVISILQLINRNHVDLGAVSLSINPPDLVIYSRRGVVLSRFMICREIDYSTSDLSEKSAKELLESYIALIKSLPRDIHIYIYKEELDKGVFLKKITNEILNTQADLEKTIDETTRVRLGVKLNKLKTLYSSLLSGKPFAKMTLMVIYKVRSEDVNSAKTIADYYESIITSIFRNHYGLRLEKARSDEITSFILGVLGLVEKSSLHSIELDLEGIAPIQPIVISKKPSLGKGIVFGFDRDTLHPVEVGIEDLYRHTVIIGPTGRGKTTLLASVIEQLISEKLTRVIAVDFKGDLGRYLPRNLVSTITPDEIPVNILEKPPGIEEVDWRALVIEAISYTGNLEVDMVLRSIIAAEKNREMGLFRDRDTSILIPYVELLKNKPRYEKLFEYLNGDLVLNMENHGAIYQNTYVSLIIGIIRYAILRRNEKIHTILAIDDAWRVLGLKTLVEIVREGRSRNLGVVISTQSPDDIPGEIVENVYNVVLFGSRNEDYLRKARKILGIGENELSTLHRLGIGEAMYVNMLSREVSVIKVNTPSAMNKTNTKSTSMKEN